MSRHTNGRPREECGVFGVFGHPEAAKLTYFGLYSLQHRGQESAGMVTSDGTQIRQHRAMGLVSKVFSEKILEDLAGNLAMGHVRYSTTGASTSANVQPLCVTHSGNTFAVAHNGNLVNARVLREELERGGSIFQTTTDSEVVVHLLARAAQEGLDQAIASTFRRLEGAYSILIMTRDRLVAIRDPQGFRPLCLGLINGGGYVVASETCALDLTEAQYLRDVEPGEVLVIDQHGLHSSFPMGRRRQTFCIFELVYFSRPDSQIFGVDVYQARKRMGAILAREAPVAGDFVMPFPDSGIYAAIGFSQASGMPFELAMIRNHYVGRTFIQPSQSMRDFGVRVKLNPVRPMLQGKKVVIVDDSIIRGTTSRSRVRSLRAGGVAEVHMLISCPPTKYPCYYGIDFASRGELVASAKTVPQIRDFLGLDSLHYLSLDGLVEATGLPRDRFCLACYTGDYPVSPDLAFHKLILDPEAGR
ncbi:MAG: amidophosphoribosyltransferase [Thermodesulfobacteriota bacterium]